MSKVIYNDLGDRMSLYEAKLLKQIESVYDVYGHTPYAETQLNKLRRELMIFKEKKSGTAKERTHHVSHTPKPKKIPLTLLSDVKNEDKEKDQPQPIQAKIKNTIGSKKDKKQKREGDDFFLAINRGVIRNDSYRRLFKGPSTVYEYLWLNIVRAHMNKDKFNILENYYLKGKLAYCTSERHIAKECFMDKNTVHRIIKDFKKAGVIKVETVKNESRRRPQNVYILGTWSGENSDRSEHYYIDSIYMPG